jgi:hypothetical protein
MNYGVTGRADRGWEEVICGEYRVDLTEPCLVPLVVQLLREESLRVVEPT